MNNRRLLPAAVIICSSLLSAGFLLNPPDERSGQHIDILMREIGHRVLHAGGDSTSRVMPVKQMADHIFQISFEGPLTFEPDTVVKVVSAIMERDGLGLPYIVTMIDCATDEIIYGFQMGRGKRDIVACLGRKQPKGCYILQVALMEKEQSGAAYMPSLSILGGGTLLAIGMLLFYPRTTGRRGILEKSTEGVVGIGSYAFLPDKGLLQREGQMVELTTKESRVLAILSREMNTTVLREKLNEIWADEGVITGRSLDVFVSKLRKRLVDDPAIRIINVHGKGYRLEVGTGD